MFEIEIIPEEELTQIYKNLGVPDSKRLILKDFYPEMKKLGVFISIVSLFPDLGYDKENQFLAIKKLAEVDKKIKLSFENNFYLEWLSLLLIKTEFWLRVYLFNKNQYANKNILNDQLSFGTLINECKGVGLKKEIVKGIKKLNSARIRYIHNFIKYDFDYDEVKVEQKQFEKTLIELEEFCKETSCRILDDASELDNVMGFVKIVRFKSPKLK